MSKFVAGDRVKVSKNHPNSGILGAEGVVRRVDSQGWYIVKLDMDGVNTCRRFEGEFLEFDGPTYKVGDTVWVESPDYRVPPQNGTVVGSTFCNATSVRVTYPNGVELVLPFWSYEVSPAREEADEEKTYTQADIDAAYQHGREDERACWVIRVEELLND